jgi:hypothetical protein
MCRLLGVEILLKVPRVKDTVGEFQGFIAEPVKFEAE